MPRSLPFLIERTLTQADQILIAEKDMSPSGRAWPMWRWSLTALSALALALSAYLGWHHLVGGAVIGCGGGSSCDQVLSSRWSSIGGVLPVSGLAAGAYLAMLVASFFIGPATAVPDRRLAWSAMLILVGAIAGSAVWFIIVQKWVIGAFCPYCMATHITGLLLAALVIWQAPRQLSIPDAALPPPTATTGETTTAPMQDGSQALPRRAIRPWPAIGRALAGLVVAGIMVVCQIGFTPPAVYRGGESQVNNLPPIDPHAVPLVG